MKKLMSDSELMKILKKLENTCDKIWEDITIDRKKKNIAPAIEWNLYEDYRDRTVVMHYIKKRIDEIMEGK